MVDKNVNENNINSNSINNTKKKKFNSIVGSNCTPLVANKPKKSIITTTNKTNINKYSEGNKQIIYKLKDNLNQIKKESISIKNELNNIPLNKKGSYVNNPPNKKNSMNLFIKNLNSEDNTQTNSKNKNTIDLESKSLRFPQNNGRFSYKCNVINDKPNDGKTVFLLFLKIYLITLN